MIKKILKTNVNYSHFQVNGKDKKENKRKFKLKSKVYHERKDCFANILTLIKKYKLHFTH
jgi:hypothetical protein